MAARLLGACASFLQSEDAQSECPETKSGLRFLTQALEQEFDISRVPRVYSAYEKLLLRRLRYRKLRNKALMSLVSELRGERQGGLVSTEVFVKVGLSNPFVNSRQLRELFKASDGNRAILSHSYIIRARDAFVEMLKYVSANQVKAAVVAEHPQPIFVTHIHDEASMRFRSLDQDANNNRGLYSKIQNNAVTVSIGATNIEWPTELQPLASKDGQTLATAMLEVMENLLAPMRAGVAASPDAGRYVVHLLIGDGVNTNENAAKKLLHELGAAVGRGLRYKNSRILQFYNFRILQFYNSRFLEFLEL